MILIPTSRTEMVKRQKTYVNVDEPREIRVSPFEELAVKHLSRRQVLKGALGAGIVTFLGGPGRFVSQVLAASPLLGFTSVPVSKDDAVHLPPGYAYDVLFAWGDPISDGPELKADASNSAADQAVQAGMAHDGMHLFPLPKGAPLTDRGLLAINYEYTDDGPLHPITIHVQRLPTPHKTENAHGVGVI